MIRHEFEGRWEHLDAKIQSKWGKRTRLQRNSAAGSRHSPRENSDDASGVREKGGPAPEKLRPWRP